jgi:rubrerythrin
MNSKILQNIQIEVDASYLYQILAENEEVDNVAHVFKEMSEIEKSHALAFLKKNGLSENQMPKPSKRAKFLHFIGKIFGYDYILGVLLDTEKSVSS